MGHTMQLGEIIVPLRKRRANFRDGRAILHAAATPSKARLPVEETTAISRKAMCEGKPTYATAAKAWATVQRRNGRKSKNKGRTPHLEPYRCPHCGSWHIGGH